MKEYRITKHEAQAIIHAFLEDKHLLAINIANSIFEREKLVDGLTYDFLEGFRTLTCHVLGFRLVDRSSYEEAADRVLMIYEKLKMDGVEITPGTPPRSKLYN